MISQSTLLVRCWGRPDGALPGQCDSSEALKTYKHIRQTSPARLKKHEGLRKHQSTVIAQIRTESLGLRLQGTRRDVAPVPLRMPDRRQQRI